jgi:hypothetical protein
MPTPAWNPGTAAVLSILERSHPGPARGEVNVIEGGRRVVGNSGQPGRSVTSMTVVILGRSALPVSFSRVCGTTRSRNCVRLCLSATCVDDSEPDPHDAGWRAATDYRPGPLAARCLAANRRTPCCRQPPKQARGSVDNMRVVSTYRPRGLGRVRPGLALGWFRGGPSPFSSTPHKRPHRPDDRRTSLSPYLRHLPGQPPTS